MARAALGKHGRDHRPDGHDPSKTGPWHFVGDSGEPALLAGSAISGYKPTCFRLVVGPQGTAANPQVKHTLEVIISLNGVSDGTTAFTLPDGYYDFAEGDKIPIHGHDSAGAYKAWHLDGSNGNIVAGV